MTRLVWPALGAVLIAVGAGAWWAGNGSTEAAPAADRPVATAVVERGTISATEVWDGTLGHGNPLTVTARAEGTVTRLVGQGETVGRGSELYRLNEQPVTLLTGVVPMYRDLGPGDAGADVQQLEANLAELGYTGFTADDEYTESTAGAVRAWQGDVVREPTGRVARGDVVFIPESVQVDALRIEVGDVVAPGTPILDLTGTDQIVSVEVDVDVDDRDRFEVDTKVTVVLPGGDEVAGTVTENTVVEGASGESFGDSTGEPVASVEVGLDDEVPETLIGSPVDVVVAIDERTDILFVPVNALLALAEGGYGLEIGKDGGTTSIVGVDTGLFADGKVEVRGDEIAEGTVVGVAGR